MIGAVPIAAQTITTIAIQDTLHSPLQILLVAAMSLDYSVLVPNDGPVPKTLHRVSLAVEVLTLVVKRRPGCSPNPVSGCKWKFETEPKTYVSRAARPRQDGLPSSTSSHGVAYIIHFVWALRLSDLSGL